MNITKFAEKYGVTKRDIEYWTELGLLHPTDGEKMSKNGKWREYNDNNDSEIKKILIAKTIANGSSLKKYVKLLDALPKELWNIVVIDQINKKIEEATRQYSMVLSYAKELQNCKCDDEE